MKMSLHTVTFLLLVIGGLNWLLVGINPSYNLVEMLLGTGTLTNTVYILVGISAILAVVTHKKDCKACGSGSSM